MFVQIYVLLSKKVTINILKIAITYNLKNSTLNVAI